MLKMLCFAICTFLSNSVFSQTNYLISGKITDKTNGKSLVNATVHLRGSKYSTLSGSDGSFYLNTSQWYDTLEVTSVGFSPVILILNPKHYTGLNLEMSSSPTQLQGVVVDLFRKPGKPFMEKVIEAKKQNNPARFRSYHYERYTRNELDVDNLDFQKAKGKGFKSILLKTYSDVDSNAKTDKELPVYFDETIARVFHSTSPRIDDEIVTAKKNLGLKTDVLFRNLDKFSFYFNIYENWIPIFNQTYASPLNEHAFEYYNFYEGDTTVVGDITIREVRFTPKRNYEKAFSGVLWIDENSLAVQSFVMHLAKNDNLNFVKDISYSQSYQLVYDSISDKMVYMPEKYISDVKFESGLDLLGIPVSENKNSVKFVFKNTTVLAKMYLNTGSPSDILSNLIKKEHPVDVDKTDEYWSENRPDSLTLHEKNIYKMVDSLQENRRFQRDLKLIAFAGSGMWNFGNLFSAGPYSLFLSNNVLEGWRFRVGLWTMPGISKRINIFGYGAYGTKDHIMKGLVGLKYVWSETHWSKTTISYSGDYDFIVNQDDELDKDNLINTVLRKNIPFSRVFIKQALIRHEQYITHNLSTEAQASYEEIIPDFIFRFRPINPATDKPYDSLFSSKLPVASASIGFRYVKNEPFTVFNYDYIRHRVYTPVLFARYTFGIELNNAQFSFNKLEMGVEQYLRVPPKMLFYYRLEAGKIFGTLPYLLLHIPAGNEYYVASKYEFNTMNPYEFASDRYVSLHTRFTFGGLLLDKIPLVRKLGWRERISFNSYWGDMTNANIQYNKGEHFKLIGNVPFMEAGAGIENIFHLLSIEYFRRLNYLNHHNAQRGGVYLGMTLNF